MALLLIYVLGALGISFLCSILEAALLSVRTASLIERAEGGNKGAALLLDIKRNRVDDAISAILTLNTIAHTIGATLAGAQAAVVFGDEWVGLFSGVLTLLVLVVTEIIPKTLGTVYANGLAGYVGRSLRILILVMRPVLVMTRALTRLVAPHSAHTISRNELGAYLAMASRQGALKGDELRVFQNFLRFDQIRVEDIQTPRTVASMLPEDAPVRTLIEQKEARVFSRIPIFKGVRDKVTGYVLSREVLSAILADEGRLDDPLSHFAREPWFLPEVATLSDALKQFLERREHLALVADEFGGVSGIVTLEDLIETILGVEIMDESDRVADLRVWAATERDRRLKRLNLVGQLPQPPASDDPDKPGAE